MLKKTLKNSAIATAVIFVLKIISGLIFDPSSFLEIFEYGVWAGVGTYLVSLVVLFIVTFLIILAGNFIFKSKDYRTN